MGWAEDKPTKSILVPSDKVKGDGRNYFVIGEGVPSEIADRVAAAIVAYNASIIETGASPGDSAQYWALGITDSNSYELIGYFKRLIGVDPNGNEFYSTHRQTMMTFSRDFGADAPAIMYLGGGESGEAYNEFGVRIVTRSVIEWGLGGTRDTLATQSIFNAGWERFSNAGASVYKDLTFYRKPDGMCLVSGVVKYLGGTGATANILTVTSSYRPPAGTRHILNGQINAAEGRGVDIRDNGDLVLRGALPTAGQFVSINGEYPLAVSGMG